MPTPLPPATDMTGSGTTKGGFKTAITALRDFLAGLLGTSGTLADARAALGTPLAATLARTTGTTVTTSDCGRLIDGTSSWTLTLPTASSAGDGWAIAVRNSGTGTITLDPAGSEQIDGAATVALAAGDACFVVCTGSAWRTVGRRTTAVSSLNGQTGAVVTTSFGAVGSVAQLVWTAQATSGTPSLTLAPGDTAAGADLRYSWTSAPATYNRLGGGGAYDGGGTAPSGTWRAMSTVKNSFVSGDDVYNSFSTGIFVRVS